MQTGIKLNGVNGDRTAVKYPGWPDWASITYGEARRPTMMLYQATGTRRGDGDNLNQALGESEQKPEAHHNSLIHLDLQPPLPFATAAFSHPRTRASAPLRPHLTENTPLPDPPKNRGFANTSEPSVPFKSMAFAPASNPVRPRSQPSKTAVTPSAKKSSTPNSLIPNTRPA